MIGIGWLNLLAAQVVVHSGRRLVPPLPPCPVLSSPTFISPCKRIRVDLHLALCVVGRVEVWYRVVIIVVCRCILPLKLAPKRNFPTDVISRCCKPIIIYWFACTFWVLLVANLPCMRWAVTQGELVHLERSLRFILLLVHQVVGSAIRLLSADLAAVLLLPDASGYLHHAVGMGQDAPLLFVEVVVEWWACSRAASTLDSISQLMVLVTLRCRSPGLPRLPWSGVALALFLDASGIGRQVLIIILLVIVIGWPSRRRLHLMILLWVWDHLSTRPLLINVANIAEMVIDTGLMHWLIGLIILIHLLNFLILILVNVGILDAVASASSRIRGRMLRHLGRPAKYTTDVGIVHRGCRRFWLVLLLPLVVVCAFRWRSTSNTSHFSNKELTIMFRPLSI